MQLKKNRRDIESCYRKAAGKYADNIGCVNLTNEAICAVGAK